MPEHDAEQPPVRPEVVQAVFSGLIDMDPGKLAPLEAAGIGITPAEQRQADQLYAASIEASFREENGAGAAGSGQSVQAMILHVP